jgi:hypothetical protein
VAAAEQAVAVVEVVVAEAEAAVVAASLVTIEWRINMKPRILKSIACSAVVLCAVYVLAVAVFAHAQTSTPPLKPQQSFATAQEAVQSLVAAAASYDVPTLKSVLGAGGEDLIASGDPVRDKSNAAAFASKAAEKTRVAVDPKNGQRATVLVGLESWPLPIPLVKKSGKWFFDTDAGRAEILFRRIGSNELDAIQVCRGYVEAQHEYAKQVHDNAGINQYAQRIISTPGKKDGLYWVKPDGTPGGPITAGIARAIQEGYSTQGGPFHGYYFRILKGQGKSAPMGRLDYVIQNVMIGGFALVAVPAEYRVTGVQTFIVNQDGIVYQKDLGPKSLDIVKNMELYDPDWTWRRTDDQWPGNAATKTTAKANH